MSHDKMGSSIEPEKKKCDTYDRVYTYTLQYKSKSLLAINKDMFTVSLITIISTPRVCIGSPSLSEGSSMSQVTSKTIFQRGGGGDFVMYASTGQLSC